MIKLFHSIRQNLLSKGKFGSYFKYALGEIVLVVIGILIALEINNASQQNTYREQVEVILKRVFYNLESDMAYPINGYLGFCSYKDSLNDHVLSKSLTFEDYESAGKGFRSYSRLLNYEFEPFQFEDQAYERMMANIEIVPEEYVTIVEMLQDVYGKEVLVVNEVAVDLKNFVDEIDDKYQREFEWYSDTDSLHFKQRVNYLLNSPDHLNDVRRHQEIVYHLEKHLRTLKMNASIAYSKIHQDILPDEPFSEIVDHFYFPSKGELMDYEGLYESADETHGQMQLISKEYYLTDGYGGVKLVKSGEDKFVYTARPETHYLMFSRDKAGDISAAVLYMSNSIGEKRTIKYNKTN